MRLTLPRANRRLARWSGDVVVVAITLKHYKAMPVGPTSGEIVVDANNYTPFTPGSENPWAMTRKLSDTVSQ